jgi:hypothetical protein
MLGDADGGEERISPGDVEEICSSLQEMQHLLMETRLPDRPQPEFNKKNSSGDAMRSSLQEMQMLETQASPEEIHLYV